MVEGHPAKVPPRPPFLAAHLSRRSPRLLQLLLKACGLPAQTLLLLRRRRLRRRQRSLQLSNARLQPLALGQRGLQVGACRRGCGCACRRRRAAAAANAAGGRCSILSGLQLGISTLQFFGQLRRLPRLLPRQLIRQLLGSCGCQLSLGQLQQDGAAARSFSWGRPTSNTAAPRITSGGSRGCMSAQCWVSPPPACLGLQLLPFLPRQLQC